jgi:hypothetical protein
MPDHSMVSHERVIIEETDADMLNVHEFPADIEISLRTARIVRQVSGFSSFRGTPTLFVTYDDAKAYLRMPAERTSYLIVKIVPGVDIRPPDDLADDLRQPPQGVRKRDRISSVFRELLPSPTIDFR